MEIKLQERDVRCKALYATVLQAVNELGIDANVVKEEDLMKIMAYNDAVAGACNKRKSGGKGKMLQEKRSIELKRLKTMKNYCYY